MFRLAALILKTLGINRGVINPVRTLMNIIGLKMNWVAVYTGVLIFN